MNAQELHHALDLMVMSEEDIISWAKQADYIMQKQMGEIEYWKEKFDKAMGLMS